MMATMSFGCGVFSARADDAKMLNAASAVAICNPRRLRFDADGAADMVSDSYGVDALMATITRIWRPLPAAILLPTARRISV